MEKGTENAGQIQFRWQGLVPSYLFYRITH